MKIWKMPAIASARDMATRALDIRRAGLSKAGRMKPGTKFSIVRKRLSSSQKESLTFAIHPLCHYEDSRAVWCRL